MTNAETAAELQRLEHARRQAAAAYEQANHERNAAVVAAAKAGVGRPAIARETGLTRERVRQILERAGMP